MRPACPLCHIPSLSWKQSSQCLDLFPHAQTEGQASPILRLSQPQLILLPGDLIAGIQINR